MPGVGKRAAVRMALHLIKQKREQLTSLTESLLALHDDLHQCQTCGNLSDFTTCDICNSPIRDRNLVCVVEDVRDIMAIERTHQYNGLYHVLHGRLDPMNGITPDQLNIYSLLQRVHKEDIHELFFALSQTMEGDLTALHLYNELASHDLKFSTIARGIAVGYQLEEADANTLSKSISNRIPFTI